MKTFQTQKILPYSCSQLFALVQDIEKYPEFLPWCTGAECLSQPSIHLMYARLDIGYQLWHCSYISKIHLESYHSIVVEQHEGPFRVLKNKWVFAPLSDTQSSVQFFLEFELKSLLMDTLLQAFFEKAAHSMIDAFEKRAQQIYC